MLLNVQLFYIFDQISEQWGFKKKATRKIRETRPKNRRFSMKQTVLIRFDCVQTSMYKVYGNTYFKIKITCDVRC